MIEIYEGDYFEADLSGLSECDLINAFLDELENSPKVLDELTKWSAEHNSNPMFNVKAIVAFQNKGFNLYRIRPLAKRINKYRIIYAYNGQRDEIYLLAIVKKEEYNYEPDDPISQRIFDEYDELELPKYH
ncbi:type II toxin-antitoxin system RelE family toxin [Oxalobacter paraformigenes]|uniref:Uncharacterized protein n=1 Tax=Oxalobacter paraformigenes TaxID=556268 RepID=C3X1S0_9BURK|nr:hypothetical protein [Oxalobacter paraformigenes]EEO27156.2 hypothetical protein OFAG_00309 [Oxalobacter paraformigenes]